MPDQRALYATAISWGVCGVIVCQATKSQFIHDTFHNDIEEVLSQQYLRSTGRMGLTVLVTVTIN